MVLDAALFNTQNYKLRIKGKVENLGKVVTLSRRMGVLVIEKEPSGRPRLWSPTLFYFIYIYIYIYI